MTIQLPTDADKASVLRAIDKQVQLSPADDAAVRRPHSAQECVQELLMRRADVAIAWGGGSE